MYVLINHSPSRVVFLFCQERIEKNIKSLKASNHFNTFIRKFSVMTQFIRTNSDNEDFVALVRQLDEDLAQRDGAEHAFYSQYNSINGLPWVIVAYENERPVACGALKAFEEDAVEVKRMYTQPGVRGKGLAATVLSELENWASELGFSKCVLETGKRQPEAIRLYEKKGYRIIPNYGQYAGIDNSICFEKSIAILR